MHIKSASFKNFKNLDLDITFSRGLNLLIKENGWGKTNLLEGIDVFSSGRSFRQLKDEDLISWGKDDLDFVKMELNIVDETNKERILKISIAKDEEDSIKKNYYINGAKTNLPKFRSFVPSLIYSPHTSDVVSDSPNIRRNIFDKVVAIFDKSYEKNLFEYKFIVKNRNKLLSQNSSRVELDYWDKRLISIGTKLLQVRLDFVKQVNDFVKDLAISLYHKEYNSLRILYQSKSVENEKIVLESKILMNKEKEYVAGISLYGPHRDDYVFSLEGKSLRIFGSRAQQRIAGLVFTLATYQMLQKGGNLTPILLLDDIASELDKKHISQIETFLLTQIQSQLILTASNKDYFSNDFKKGINLL